MLLDSESSAGFAECAISLELAENFLSARKVPRGVGVQDDRIDDGVHLSILRCLERTAPTSSRAKPLLFDATDSDCFIAPRENGSFHTVKNLVVAHCVSPSAGFIPAGCYLHSAIISAISDQQMTGEFNGTLSGVRFPIA